MISPEEVRAAIDTVALIGRDVRLKRSGNGVHIGICPNHNGKTPHLWVYPGDRGFHCFTCGFNGDIFDWVQWRDKVDFKTALRQLAAEAGLTDEKPAERPILQPKDPAFPHPRHEPVTSWGGQHLLSDPAPNQTPRPVFIFNEFPGRRRYLEMAEQMPAFDFLWWPDLYSTADRMYLAPIAARTVRLDGSRGLWEAYRALALLDALAGFRRAYRGKLDPRVEIDLVTEVGSHMAALGHFLRARSGRSGEAHPVPSIAPGPAAPLQRDSRDVAA